MEGFITDWASADVGVNAKGSYNASDLNRVGEAVNWVAAQLGLGIAAKTDWKRTDFPTRAAMEKYIRDLQAVRNAAHLLSTTPTIPQAMDYLDHVGANHIEQMLSDVIQLIRNGWTAQGWCGTIQCGYRGIRHGI